jgi:pilus assembly protein CpaB
VSARRRRGLLLLCVALASGGVAASEVSERERRASEQLGPSVDVIVAARDLRAGARISRDAIAARRIPARFAPPDALPSPDVVIGARLVGSVAAGAYLTASLFQDGDRTAGRALRAGERAVTIEVAGGSVIAAERGERVDVLVSTETGAAGGRTTMALAGAELLQIEAGASPGYDPGDAAAGDPSVAGPTAVATLRVSVDQAIYLTAADNFAREIRLLPRPPSDHTRAGGTVSNADL